jgi:iron complex outermembrane recepter protein
MRRCFRRHALIVGADGIVPVKDVGRVMSINRRRALLLSSSALVLLCLAGVASSQTPATPPEGPPATTTPETPPAPTPAPETPAPQPSPPAPETPQAEPGTPPALPIPQVTVEAPKPRPARRTAPAAPARTTTPSPPPPAPPTTTPPTAPTTTTTAGQPAATSPQPPPSLSTLNSAQIQASQSNSVGGLFFTMPGATSAGLSPGTQRPVLRGLDDFRVRVQENGVGTMDVSDYGQDHGVPLDPLAIQKVQILRGPEALRYGSQAVGGIVEATNNRIPFLAPPGGWQTQILGATTTVDRGAEGGALFDAGSRDFAFHADVYGRRSNDYFIPSYPYLFPSDPAPPFNGKQPNSSFHSEGQAVGGSYLFDGGYVGAAVSRFSTLYHIPTMEGAATNGRIALEQVKYTSRGEFRPTAWSWAGPYLGLNLGYSARHSPIRHRLLRQPQRRRGRAPRPPAAEPGCSRAAPRARWTERSAAPKPVTTGSPASGLPASKGT